MTGLTRLLAGEIAQLTRAPSSNRCSTGGDAERSTLGCLNCGAHLSSADEPLDACRLPLAGDGDGSFLTAGMPYTHSPGLDATERHLCSKPCASKPRETACNAVRAASCSVRLVPLPVYGDRVREPNQGSETPPAGATARYTDTHNHAQLEGLSRGHKAGPRPISFYDALLGANEGALHMARCRATMAKQMMKLAPGAMMN